MARLIHFNGPPGIGKSTLAQLYVDRHPPVLNLDIDRLRPLIGGWDDDFSGTGELVRPIASAMADAHLQAGWDVVMPQYLGRPEEIEKFEAVAIGCGAAFIEVALMDARESSVERFVRRSERAEQPWHVHVRQVVESAGGKPVLADMYDRLADVLASRPSVIVVSSREGEIQQTYDALVAGLLRKSAGTHRAVAVVVSGDRVLVMKRRLHGRDYAVLPGGGVEDGELPEQAAVRELEEETTLSARAERVLWRGHHRDRDATYFLMSEVRGNATLSGPEAKAHCAENIFTLVWAAAEQFGELNLQPADIRQKLTELLLGRKDPTATLP